MSFLLLHKLVTYLLAGFGLFGLTVSGAMPITTAALVGLATLASWFVEGDILDHPRYSTTWNVVLVVALAIQTMRAFAGESILPLGIEFAALLQVSRLMYRRRAVDHQQITVLAFLHLIAATVLSTGLDYAITFIAYVIVVPWMLVLTHLRGSIEQHHGDGDPNKGRARQLLRSKSIAGPKLLFATASLSVPLFLVTATFFLAFPRIGMGFLSFGDATGRSVAGFGSNVELGGFGTIRDDPTVVLRIRTKGSQAQKIYRMRGTSFDRYQDGKWSRSAEKPQKLMAMGMDYFALKNARQGDKTLEVIMDNIDEPVIFIPEGTVGFKIAPNVRGGIPEPRRIARARGLDIRYLDGDGRDTFYKVYTDGSDSIPARSLKDDERNLYLQLPEGQERIAQLTSKLLSKQRGLSEHRKADLIQRWLGQSGGFTYSLKQTDPKGKDPLSVFLFESKSGHCEYFSTAMAVMLRTAGIPSRNVTGFVGGQLNPYGGYYEIRQGDAHSWVEAYVDGVWTRYDPTPSASVQPVVDTSFLQTIRQMVDALRTQWSDRVVDYNLRDQVRAFQSVRRWFSSIQRFDQEPEQEEKSNQDFLRASGVPFWAVAMLIGLLLLALLIFVLQKRFGKSDKGMTALLRKLDRKLEKLGAPRPAQRTVTQHITYLKRSETLDSESTLSVELVTEAYLQERFGEKFASEQQLRGFSKRIKELRRR